MWKNAEQALERRLAEARQIIEECGMEAIRKRWVGLTFPDNPEQTAMILAKYGRLTSCRGATKRCNLCGRTFPREIFGKQTYCKNCWPSYNRQMMKAKYYGKPTDGLINKIWNQLACLCPRCGKTFFDPRVKRCSCGADLSAIPWIKNQDLGGTQNENL